MYTPKKMLSQNTDCKKKANDIEEEALIIRQNAEKILLKRFQLKIKEAEKQENEKKKKLMKKNSSIYDFIDTFMFDKNKKEIVVPVKENIEGNNDNNKLNFLEQKWKQDEEILKQKK